VHNLQLRFSEEIRQLLVGFIEALRKEAKLPYRGVDLLTLNSKIVEAERLLSFHDMNYFALKLAPIRLEKKRLEQQVAHMDMSTSNSVSTLERLEKDMFFVENQYITANIRLLEEKQNYLNLQTTDRRKLAELFSNTAVNDGEIELFYDAAESEYELQKFYENCVSASPTINKGEFELSNQNLASFRNRKLKLETKFYEGRLLSSFAMEQSSSELNRLLEFENQRKSLLSERLRSDREIALQLICDYRANKIPDPAIAMKLSNQSVIYEQKSDMADIAASPTSAYGTDMLSENSPTTSTTSPLLAQAVPPPPPPPPPPVLPITPVAVVFPLEAMKKNGVDSSPVSEDNDAQSAMDSVIDQIKNGTVQLKKVDKSAIEDDKNGHDRSLNVHDIVQTGDVQNEVVDAMDSVIDELKSSIVHLKEVDKSALIEKKKRKSYSKDPSSKLLRATMTKIEKASNLSDEESDDGSDFDD